MCIEFKWTSVEQETFEDIKQTGAKETLLVHPHFNIHFDIHIYASNYLIGAVIIQEVKPIVFNSHKLTGI